MQQRSRLGMLGRVLDRQQEQRLLSLVLDDLYDQRLAVANEPATGRVRTALPDPRTPAMEAPVL